MHVYKVRNPDPAWPEVGAIFVLALLCLTDGFSSLSFFDFLAVNWWPLLRIALVFWMIFRIVDLFQGGPMNRRLMRAAYRNVQAHLKASQQSGRF